MSWKHKEPIDNMVDDCGFCKNETFIVLNEHVYDVVRTLCAKIKTEWQVLMIGELIEGTVVVSDYYIPEQEVTAGTVNNKECIDEAFCDEHHVIGTIHSHSNMNTFFSSTDDDMTNTVPFLRAHVVVNNALDMKAVYRKKLPCGKEFLQDATVLTSTLNEEDIPGFDKIKKREVKAPYRNYGYSGYGWQRDNDNKKPNKHADFDIDAFNEELGTISYEGFNNTELFPHGME